MISDKRTPPPLGQPSDLGCLGHLGVTFGPRSQAPGVENVGVFQCSFAADLFKPHQFPAIFQLPAWETSFFFRAKMSEIPTKPAQSECS